MNTQKPLKVKVSITLDEDVIHQIRALAETDDRNFSQYINLVLKKHLNDTQKKEDGVRTTGLAGGLLHPCKGLIPACARKAHRKVCQLHHILSCP